MGHFPGIACWRHTSGVTASSSLNIIMIRLALTLVSLVATIYAQDAPETPLWFLETSLDGPFRERSAACPPLLETRQDEASFGPTWFETSDSSCSSTDSAINGPTLFRGKDLDPKSICMQLDDGSYEFRQGFLSNCGGPCCIFYGEAAESK